MGVSRRQARDRGIAPQPARRHVEPPRLRDCRERTELIFDAATYQLIGVNNVPAPGKPAMPGRPSSTLLRIAVVNNIGQLP